MNLLPGLAPGGTVTSTNSTLSLVLSVSLPGSSLAFSLLLLSLARLPFCGFGLAVGAELPVGGLLRAFSLRAL